MNPKVSVIMPVYNGERYLAQAIESILTQTFKDYEFIIICEYGSNQETLNIISDYAKEDCRIIVISNIERLGIAASLNKGIKHAKGKYLARMDGDDISLPERLAVQVDHMEKNPEVTICASRVAYIDESGRPLYYKDNLSEDPEQLKADLLFFCFIHHSSIIFRKDTIINQGLFYDESYKSAEDYELWCRASHLVEIAVIPNVLLKYRWSQKSSSHSEDGTQEINCIRVMQNNLNTLLITASSEELSYLHRVSCREKLKSAPVIRRELDKFYSLIIEKNRELNVYQERCLTITLNMRMYWKQHRVRRLAVVIIKAIAEVLSSRKIFLLAIYLELNGFSSVIKRALNINSEYYK